MIALARLTFHWFSHSHAKIALTLRGASRIIHLRRGCTAKNDFNLVSCFPQNTTYFRKPQLISGKGGFTPHASLPKICPCNSNKKYSELTLLLQNKATDNDKIYLKNCQPIINDVNIVRGNTLFAVSTLCHLNFVSALQKMIFFPENKFHIR